MKKINLFSVASLIRGRKSSGVEDSGTVYKHWKEPNKGFWGAILDTGTN